jgi:hypothetical protein
VGNVPTCANLSINFFDWVFTLKVSSEVLVGRKNVVAIDEKQYLLTI